MSKFKLFERSKKQCIYYYAMLSLSLAFICEFLFFECANKSSYVRIFGCVFFFIFLFFFLLYVYIVDAMKFSHHTCHKSSSIYKYKKIKYDTK